MLAQRTLYFFISLDGGRLGREMYLWMSAVYLIKMVSSSYSITRFDVTVIEWLGHYCAFDISSTGLSP
jgi:hypothetical protein